MRPPTLIPAGLPGEVRHRTVGGHSGVELAVVEVGDVDDVDRAAVVIAHGVGSSARFVAEAFAAPVVAAGARLVAYDLRGHGASAPVRTVEGHHLDRHVADLDAVAASTAGVEVIGGVSLGGHAAVRVASRASAHPQTRVCVACLPAWSGDAELGHGPHAAVADEVATVGIEAVLERLRADTVMAGWLREALVTDYARHDSASLTAALLALDGGGAPEPDELAALSVPLGLVAWPHDPGHPIEVARRWRDATPTADLVEIAIADLEDDRTALGAAALRSIGSAWPRPK